MAEEFFRAVALLVPDATHMFLEGSPDADIELLLMSEPDKADYVAPIGTVWSWPRTNRRFSVRASSQLFERLAEAAPHHAEPEVCDHVHFYRGKEALAQCSMPFRALSWFQSQSRVSTRRNSCRDLRHPVRRC